jgi:hypothetical protein
MKEQSASSPPNPYGHRCNTDLPTKAILDCPACAYERGVADGFKAGYEAAK